MTTARQRANEYSPAESVLGLSLWPDEIVAAASNFAVSDITTLIEGDGYAIITIEQPKPVLTESEYPVLAAIWDNDDDDAAFDSL